VRHPGTPEHDDVGARSHQFPPGPNGPGEGILGVELQHPESEGDVGRHPVADSHPVPVAGMAGQGALDAGDDPDPGAELEGPADGGLGDPEDGDRTLGPQLIQPRVGEARHHHGGGVSGPDHVEHGADRGGNIGVGFDGNRPAG